MDENNLLLTQIKTNLERLLDREWPKVEKVIEGHEDRLRRLEMYQVKLDNILPRIDDIASELKRGVDNYAHTEDIKKLEIQLNDVKKELDSVKSYMWKTIGAIAVIAFLIPLVLRFV